MDLKHLDLDICFTPNLGGPTTRMLTKSRQSLCHVAWTLVPAVGSALVCQSKHPGQPCGIVFINVALDKKNHSIVDKQDKKSYKSQKR